MPSTPDPRPAVLESLGQSVEDGDEDVAVAEQMLPAALEVWPEWKPGEDRPSDAVDRAVAIAVYAAFPTGVEPDEDAIRWFAEDRWHRAIIDTTWAAAVAHERAKATAELDQSDGELVETSLDRDQLADERDRLMDELTRSEDVRTKLAQTIAACPEGHHDANLAHARAERDALRVENVKLRTPQCHGCDLTISLGNEFHRIGHGGHVGGGRLLREGAIACGPCYRGVPVERLDPDEVAL